MKIDSITNYMANKPDFRHKPLYAHDNGDWVGMYKDKSENRGYYSGSFTGKNEAAVNVGSGLVNKMFRSNWFQHLLHIFEEKSVVASTLVALIVAGIARPATNLAMAGKNDREDSIYAASHAISSALIGFIVSSIVMAPFDKAFRRIKENPKDYLKGLEDLLEVKEIGKRKLEKSKPYKKLSKMAQFIPDVILAIPKAMLTIALIPPILKYVFHIEKHKKQENPQKNKDIQKYASIANKPTFAKFQEGVK